MNRCVKQFQQDSCSLVYIDQRQQHESVVNVSVNRACSHFKRNLQHNVASLPFEQICVWNQAKTEIFACFTTVKWAPKVSVQIMQNPNTNFSERKNLKELDLNFLFAQMVSFQKSNFWFYQSKLEKYSFITVWKRLWFATKTCGTKLKNTK